MAIVKPLVFNPAVGTPEVLQASDVLQLEAAARFSGLVGFGGKAPVAAPSIGADFFGSLDELITGLAAVGLISDRRPPGWALPLTIKQMASLGPYEPGRLITGGLGGWQQLDMPAAVPGVIQVPVSHAGAPETNPITGLTVKTLAYSPVLSYSATAPSATTAMAGALWYDTAGQQLMVYTGAAWQPVLQGALSGIAAASGRGLVYVDGGSGSVLTPGRAGQSLASTGGTPLWVEWIHTATTPAWGTGSSANDPLPTGGGRPAGVTSAIWCNPATNAETIGFWDEAERRWKSVYVNNPVLNQLAELRSTIVDGDLFTVSGNRVSRLGLGPEGSGLSSVGGQVVWRDRFRSAAVAPSAPSTGDLWRQESTGVFHVYDGRQWLPIRDVSGYTDINASSSALTPGVPLVHTGLGWALADGRTAVTSPQILGVASAACAPGAAATVSVGGVVSASEAQWHAVIDPRDGTAAATGLVAGASYYLSGNGAGLISVTPGPGRVLMGTALDGTHLLLQVGQFPLPRPYGQVHQATSAPSAAVANELWWNPAAQTLSVAGGIPGALTWTVLASGGSGGGAGGTTPGGTGVSLVDLEAIDWLADPKAAALRFTKSDGTVETVRVKGTGGAVVTMSDDHTLCIDAPMPPGGGGVVIDGGRFSP